MASAEALHGEDPGPVIPGGCFLNSLFIVPERWGEGLGGLMLDAVIAEAIPSGTPHGSTSRRMGARSASLESRHRARLALMAALPIEAVR